MKFSPWTDVNHIPKPVLLLVVRPLLVFLHVFVGAEILLPAFKVITSGSGWKQAASEHFGPILTVCLAAAGSAFGKGMTELLAGFGKIGLELPAQTIEELDGATAKEAGAGSDEMAQLQEKNLIP